MSTDEEFWAAEADAALRPRMADPLLTGCRLSWAAARVLGAQGAGISLSSNAVLRLPWGASDEDSSTTERLQFTVGEGPCITAHSGQEMIMATERVLASTWPAFAGQLQEHTPFRSVFGAPLHRLGALNLYFTEPTGCTRLDIGRVLVVTQQILAAMMNGDFLATLGLERAGRMPAITRRTEVSVALGMLSVALHVSHTDALALLRGQAYAADRTVDDLAADIVSGTLGPQDIVR